MNGPQEENAINDLDGVSLVEVNRNRNDEDLGIPIISSELDIRSQRFSDTYPVRANVYDQTNTLPVRLYRRFVSQYVLQPIIHLLFPRVLNNLAFVKIFGFRQTTQVKLLCPWTCEDGHVCQYYEGHTGRHKCVFNHPEGESILKCPHICDCRDCEADCVYKPGHGGIHKCHFRHIARDIPGSKAELAAFKDDKSIGDYINELAYNTQEDTKFSHIPETLDPKDEDWVNT
ncbi:hypothetical protein AKO1_007526 [Acrasis kona]|uniref:C3H1-type domain-containing protein n=1 Tax=Acrasis kona TaxID=1008807 RepID=A0AAW2YS57_9EUKA